MNKASKWTLQGFVENFGFIHHKMPDYKFVWVLGAGASYPSEIPLGSALVDNWLQELHLRQDDGRTPLQEWATADNLDIPNFDYNNRSTFYPKIYQRRFRDHPDQGYAYLEGVMSGKEPSPGYSILASALAADPPRHNALITTNFDNLVADALAIYTDTFPFVCGHESLVGFVRIAMRRPLICKIHRDLLLAPQNDPHSLHRLNDAWGTALRALFQHYTPLVIGYGGNDDTLMDLLESLHPGDIRGQMIWCYYERSQPSERIVNVVTDKKGVLVPVPDFDLLMVLLGEQMGISFQDHEIDRRAKERMTRYSSRIRHLPISKDRPEVQKAFSSMLSRSGNWWSWAAKAWFDEDEKRRETNYREALSRFPQNALLHGSFAAFLVEVLDKHQEAKEYYRKAIDLDPTDALNIGNYAELLLVDGQLEEAAEKLEQAKLENKGRQNQLAAALELNAAILARIRGEDDTQALTALKDLLLEGFPRNAWVFTNLLKFVGQNCSSEDQALYSAIAASILNLQEISDIDTLLKQRSIGVSGAIATKKQRPTKPRSKRQPRQRR